MATRRVMIGDQEIEIPEFNFKIMPVIIAGIVLWLLTGIYIVGPDEVGVVRTFGEFTRVTQSGLNWKFPAPIETANTPKVTEVKRIEIGFRSLKNGQYRTVEKESLMLTGDENIVDLNFTIFWIINDAKDFLFNVRNPEITIKSIGESVMREKIGQTPIDPILSEGKSIVEEDVKNKTQSVLDYYKSGILITQVQLQKADPPELVIESYRDVQRAKTDEQRLRRKV